MDSGDIKWGKVKVTLFGKELECTPVEVLPFTNKQKRQIKKFGLRRIARARISRKAKKKYKQQASKQYGVSVDKIKFVATRYEKYYKRK